METIRNAKPDRSKLLFSHHDADQEGHGFMTERNRGFHRHRL